MIFNPMSNEEDLYDLENLDFGKIELLKKMREFQIKRMTMDLDEVMSNSQVPVIDRASMVVGKDYTDRRLDYYGALEDWIVKDFGIEKSEASRLSWFLWTYGPVLSKAKPNGPIQRYSQKAAEHGVEEYVVTGRKFALEQTTLDWVAEYYSWIESSGVMITRNNTGLYDPEHKVKILERIRPDVHLEDSMSDVRKILEANLPTYILWFARTAEFAMINDNRVITIPDMDTFSRLMAIED